MCFLDKYFGPAPAMVRKTGKKQQRKVVGRQSSGKQPASKPAGLHTFVVQKPFCCPAEGLIRNALEPFAIPITNYSEISVASKDMDKRMKIEQATRENLRYGPEMFELYKTIAIEATFTVPAGQAKWAEYLMESTGRLIVVGGNLDKRNREWGEKRNGAMPVAWDAGEGRKYARGKAGIKKPTGHEWIETGCATKLEIISKQKNKGKRK